MVQHAFVNGPVSSDNVAVLKKTELTKKMEIQSPSKKSAMKPAVRQTRPTQHHSCPRRRPTGDTLSCLSAGEPPEHQFPQHLTSTVSFNLVLASIFLYWLKQFTFVMCVSLLLITIKIDCHTCFIWLHLFFCTFSLCSFKSNLTPSRKLRFTVVESL